MTGPDVIPTRSAALDALAKFAPRAGHLYATQRNYDLGADQHDNVSQLSPYIRHRLITEQEVLDAVLAHHSPQDAQKFIAEVFWRTYWKGWLEMRPDVWAQYQSDLTQAWNNVQTQSGMRSRWQDACMGQTGIACFDHWALELAQTGYLHNHARMWFASIWIFTLKLPWVLGADFFLRHLLDGDCASNTLSWRWVAGLQTRGKHYLAEPENIARFTKGRFRPQAGDLDTDAQPLDGSMPPHPSAPPTAQDIDLTRPSALLLHMDDLAPDDLLDEGLRPMVTIVLPPSERMTPLRMSDKVQTFRSAALLDVTNRLAERLGDVVTCAPGQTVAAAKAAGAEQIVTHYAPTGPVADNLAQIDGLPLHQALRPFDARAWPYATKGFFKFKDKIPELLAAMRDKAPA